MAKAIIWVRTSTEEQECETQKEILTKKAIQSGKFKEEDLIYIGEAGASAIKMNERYQQEVNQLLATIQNSTETTTVYVWEVSRLARNELAFYQMKNALIDRHIQLICDVPSISLLDDDGEVNTGAELSLNLLVTLAKQEMTIKKKRFSRGKERLAKQGKYNGGAIPFGYKIGTDNLIVEDEVEGRVVRDIFNMYEAGYSQPAIAKELFSRGVKGRAARKTKNFTISLVHQILTNELLTGKPHKSKGASFVRQYPQIITEDQYERCRKIANENNTVLPKSRRVYYGHKLIECTECGRTFVSTGNKGYYRCKDAYDYNKKYDGYDGVPMCPNRVCISTNIMDSLLWALAIKFETFFILNDAEKTIADFKNRIRILQEKVEAIPSRLQSLRQKAERLNEVYIGGTMDREQFLRLQTTFTKEKNDVQRERAKYMGEIERYETMINQTNRILEGNADVKFMSKAQSVYEKVASITDDQERSDIIHRHIAKVTVEKTRITQTFAIHPEGKLVNAKKITIYPFGREQEVYFFIANDGKGGRMLSYQDYEKVEDHLPNVKPFKMSVTEKQTYIPFEMEYLQRIKDTGKYRRREEAKVKRESEQSQAIEEMRRRGYISMDEMRSRSHLSYCTIYQAIKDGRLAGKRVFRKWYVKETEYQQFIDQHKPRPRPKK